MLNKSFSDCSVFMALQLFCSKAVDLIDYDYLPVVFDGFDTSFTQFIPPFGTF